MRILHVFDHSLPLHSGYTFRSRSILKAQHDRGWQTVHVTGGKHPATGEEEEPMDCVFTAHRIPVY